MQTSCLQHLPNNLLKDGTCEVSIKSSANETQSVAFSVVDCIYYCIISKSITTIASNRCQRPCMELFSRGRWSPWSAVKHVRNVALPVLHNQIFWFVTNTRAYPLGWYRLRLLLLPKELHAMTLLTNLTNIQLAPFVGVCHFYF